MLADNLTKVTYMEIALLLKLPLKDLKLHRCRKVDGREKNNKPDVRLPAVRRGTARLRRQVNEANPLRF